MHVQGRRQIALTTVITSHVIRGSEPHSNEELLSQPVTMNGDDSGK
jgi:hypothetical protein